jgi:hypothetical protein
MHDTVNQNVQVEVRDDKIWINVDGRCIARIQNANSIGVSINGKDYYLHIAGTTDTCEVNELSDGDLFVYKGDVYSCAGENMNTIMAHPRSDWGNKGFSTQLDLDTRVLRVKEKKILVNKNDFPI